jgi:hypothetical protein
VAREVNAGWIHGEAVASLLEQVGQVAEVVHSNALPVATGRGVPKPVALAVFNTVGEQGDKLEAGETLRHPEVGSVLAGVAAPGMEDHDERKGRR